ncbi:C39 family peptidase, partial [Patescibacteria group bacterium]
SKKIQELLGGIKELQQVMKKEVGEIEEKREGIKLASTELIEKNETLQGTKTQKRTLLAQTQGEEAKYQNKLKKVEAQKQELLGDIDELYNANYAELDKMALGLDRPSTGLASTKWYYSQKDSRWKNTYIGNSKSKMKDYGCAISAVAMVFSYHGDKITPGSLAKKPIFYWDLISWPGSSSSVGLSGKVQLSINTKHAGVDWGRVDKELKKDNPVIVFVSAKGKAGHYVVIHGKDKKGKYVVHDPYFGPNIYLDSTMKLLSKLYSVSVSKRSIDQMILYK